MKDPQTPEIHSLDASAAKVKQKGVWKRFFHTLRVANLPFGIIAVYMALMLVEGKILVSIPQVNANFFSGDVSAKSVGMFIAMELVSMVVVQAMLFLNHVIRYRTNRNLRNVLWGKILHLKPSYYDRVPSSTLISRITVDTEAINEFVLDVVLELITSSYYLILTIREMSGISLKAGMMLMVFSPLSVLITFLVGRLTMRFENSAKFEMSNLTEYLSELISCLPLLKAFNMQAYEHRRGKKAVNDYYKANRNLVGLEVVSQLIGSLVGCLPEIVIILMGIRLLKNGEVDTAGWYTFYLYAGSMLGFVSTLGGIWTRAKSIQGRLNKVTDVLYEEEENVEGYVRESMEAGDVSFDNVTFSYGDKNVLNNVSFTVPGKQVTALVGYSGSGKTTILKLLERIYEPAEGRIMAAGRDIASYGIRAWRENVAYVMQDPPLISGTIRENLLYGIRREVSQEEIDRVLRQTHLEEFIASLPEGLDYEVGQFGSRLSGGQRQKIAVAGSILSSAEVLILDEPTASLDIISTSEIVNTVADLAGQRTVILVTHDKQAIGAAGHIIAVDREGQIAEGDLKQMLQTSGFFCRMMEE